jgi:acylphosphatase
MKPSVKKRVHVFYSGRVQGVGFRMTAEEAARELGVVGWVKNLRDGRVEVIAEADEATLERFLSTVRSGSMKNFIRDVELSWGNASDTFDEFEVRYY